MNDNPTASKRSSAFAYAAVLATLAVVFAAVAVRYTRRFHIGFGAAAGIYLCFLTLLGLALLPGFEAGRALFRGWRAGWRSLPSFLLFCVPYLFYALGTGDFRAAALLRVALIAVALPAIYILFPPRDERLFGIGDAGAGVLLIAAVLGGWLRHIWSVPANLDFMGRLLLIAVASITWTWIRPVPEFNYRWRSVFEVCKAAGLNFLYFAAIAIPAGLLIGFTEWNPRWQGFLPFCLSFLEIFLFIALLEETFFRGFLQSLLSRTVSSAVWGQAIVALLFGFFHILHAPFPNWRYVALATVAGWFYGQAYRQGGTLLASALTHALVDTVWRTWFTRV